MRFLFVGPALCYRLPSDPASRRRPCPSLALPPDGCARDFHPLVVRHAGRTRVGVRREVRASTPPVCCPLHPSVFAGTITNPPETELHYSLPGTPIILPSIILPTLPSSSAGQRHAQRPSFARSAGATCWSSLVPVIDVFVEIRRPIALMNTQNDHSFSLSEDTTVHKPN